MALATVLLVVVHCDFAPAQHPFQLVMPEQREIQFRDPTLLPHQRVPRMPSPPTVADPKLEMRPRFMSLDEAIRISLENVEVVRVLAGVTAVSSGRTIYDPAISNTVIDQEQAKFDPSIEVLNSFNRSEPPQAVPHPADPTRTQINGIRTDDYNMGLDLTKQTITGGVARFGVNTNPSRFRPGIFPLNPQNRSSAEFSYTQPLLEGGGIRANLVPIVIARIDTERSYFQFKDSVQSMVSGVVEAYWSLVFARTDVWARQQQVEQAQGAYDLTRVENRVGRKNVADVAETRVALANFRANLISAEANLLQREDALRNILGLPPTDSRQIVPVSPPSAQRQEFDWNALVALAEVQRPDLIELKLIIEADEQLLIQARNQAQPSVDAMMLYRWNGLEGEMPNGFDISSRTGQFTDWTLGVNFSVPIGLRQSRASLRRQELVIVRDWANLRQGFHSVLHVLAVTIRDLAQSYEQYEAFKEVRQASRLNLEAQMARYRGGFTPFLNVLLAISDWGNAVSSEAQALTQYNAGLARLEQETGTILESHGIHFTEERFGSLGPLGRLRRFRLYPSAVRPGPNADRYRTGNEPAEESFGLDDPVDLRRRRSRNDRERFPAPLSPLPDP